VRQGGGAACMPVCRDTVALCSTYLHAADHLHLYESVCSAIASAAAAASNGTLQTGLVCRSSLCGCPQVVKDAAELGAALKKLQVGMLCTDLDKGCPEWAAAGECGKNP
jgi:hypothetical protein